MHQRSTPPLRRCEKPPRACSAVSSALRPPHPRRLAKGGGYGVICAVLLVLLILVGAGAVTCAAPARTVVIRQPTRSYYVAAG